MAKKSENTEVRHWLDEIKSAKKREKDYRKDGDSIIQTYSGEKCDTVPFNILFSNTETLLPALFSQVPRPVVQRRFKDDDPIGLAAAKAGQRMLEFLCDTNVEGYETYADSMENATLDGLLPGRGVTQVKYDAEIIEGEIPQIAWEQVCTDSTHWKRFYVGYAKKWSKVPWIAFETYLDKKECEDLEIDPKIIAQINFTTGEDDEEDEKGQGTGGKDDNLGERKTALVYQIWDKSKKQIKYVSPNYTDGLLKEEDDPLGITGFFNVPRPLQFVKKSNDLVPTAMYKLYENQAKELNRLTTRLNKVIEAIKVRGAYDGNLGKELEQIFESDDNALVPAEIASVLSTEKGFDNAIWMIPIDKLIIVARELFGAREQCKRVIYEITGISDILRGQSVASETLGAQKIKESWGTMRLKRLQKEVQRYCRDILRMMLEVAAAKLSENTWAKATGLPFNTDEQVQQLTMSMQAMSAQAQQMAITVGQPPPELQQQLQQVQQELQKPKWSDILSLLRDDIQRAYRIDIETNSTIDVEATEDQKLVGDFMNAMGQLMAGLNPMVESGVMPFEAAKAMMLAVVRKFRFGNEVEDQLKAMTAPQKGNPEADKAKQEMQKVQADSQVKMQELQQKSQMAQQELQATMTQQMMEFKAEMQLEFAKLQANKEAELAKIQAQREMEVEKISLQRSTEQMKATIQRDTEIKKAQMQGEIEIQKASIAAAAQVMSAKQTSEETEEPQEDNSEIINTLAETLKTLTAPKKVIRDKQGLIESVVTVQNGD